MLNGTKDQPANTEEQKPGIVLHRFSDLLFQQPASSLVLMHLKTSLEVSEQWRTVWMTWCVRSQPRVTKHHGPGGSF